MKDSAITFEQFQSTAMPTTTNFLSPNTTYGQFLDGETSPRKAIKRKRVPSPKVKKAKPAPIIITEMEIMEPEPTEK